MRTAVATELKLSAKDLRFGNVIVGQTRSLPATLTNTGAKAVKISSISSSASRVFHVGNVKLPFTLEPGRGLEILIRFRPIEAGSVTGRILFDKTAASLEVQGQGVKRGGVRGGGSESALRASPTSIAFANVQVGESAKLPIVLTNTGTSPITISEERPAGVGFTIVGLKSPLTLEPRHSFRFSIEFSPHIRGTVSSVLKFTNRGETAVAIPMRGTGIAAGQLSDVPAAMNFGDVTVGTSASRSGTLRATEGNVTLRSVTSSSSAFLVSGISFPVTIAAGHSVHYTVKFTPRQSGTASAALSFASNAFDSEVSESLTGKGRTKGGGNESALRANPASLIFGNVQVGESAKLPIAVTNSGHSSITVSDGRMPGDGFTVVGLTSPLTLDAGQSFTFSIEFSPQRSGTVSSDLTFTDHGQTAVAIPLRGTGAATGRLSDVPAGMNFGNVTVGRSASRSGTLSATEGNVTVRSVTSDSSEFVLSGISLPVTIAAGHSVHYTVKFTPQQSGTASATLSFSSNALDSKVSESLTGSGVQANPSVVLNWNASTSKVIGYNVYRGSQSGGPYAKINQSVDSRTTFTDTSVAAGQTYYYVIAAVNSSGQQSKYSNQAQVEIP